jgi:hypothetical protein
MAVAAMLVAGSAWAQGQYKSGTDLTGTWQIVATIPAGVPVCPGPADCVYPALATATSDGTVLQTAPISNTLTGHGSWKRTGPRDFRAHTIYFRVDPSTGIFVGTSETTIDVTVAPGGMSAEGSFTAVIRDASGAYLTDYSGTVLAQRVVVD